MDMEIKLSGAYEDFPTTLADLSAKFNGERAVITNPLNTATQEKDARAEMQQAADVAELEGATVSAPPATNVERDSRGVAHDERVHTKTKGKKADGSWKRKPGLTDEEFEAIETELLATAVKPVTVAQAPADAPTPPAPPKPPAPGATPVAPPKPPAPAPGATPVAPPAPPAPPAGEVPTGLAGELTKMLGDIIANNVSPDPQLFTDFGVTESGDIGAEVRGFLALYDPSLEIKGLKGLTELQDDDLNSIKDGIAVIWPNL